MNRTLLVTLLALISEFPAPAFAVTGGDTLYQSIVNMFEVGTPITLHKLPTYKDVSRYSCEKVDKQHPEATVRYSLPTHVSLKLSDRETIELILPMTGNWSSKSESEIQELAANWVREAQIQVLQTTPDFVARQLREDPAQGFETVAISLRQNGRTIVVKEFDPEHPENADYSFCWKGFGSL